MSRRSEGEQPGTIPDSVTASAEWRALEALAGTTGSNHLRDLFARDATRAQRYRARCDSLLLDYSRQRVDDAVLEGLAALAGKVGVASWRDRLFAGEAVNHTEDRAALHPLLRWPDGEAAPAAGLSAALEKVVATRRRIRELAAAVREGAWGGATGKPVRDVVNIGIGGSHLGPELVVSALAAARAGPKAHFLANIDPAGTARVLDSLNPETTLFVVTSKTFTTQETLTNAALAREWLVAELGEDATPKHFLGVTAMPERARDFGIAPRNIFEFDEWVGGRYSVWSAVGLPVALCLGTEAFDALLAGGHAMDRHFLTAPFGENLPMLAGLLGIWNINFLGYDNLAVIPYRQSLELLPSYLQQLEMESNGKSVRRDGQPVDYATAPVLWGQVGTNAQHAFFQLLHQGTVPGAVDFILPLPERDRFPGAADQLVANCLAQWEALAMGRTDSDTRDRWDAHRRFPGNRPSSLLALDRLDARGLGALLALYEHKVLVQSCVWDINPFDQMGVELGKRLAGRILRAMAGGRERLDPATRGFLDDFPHAT